MRTFDFTVLAVLSYVAVIGATPLGTRAPADPVDDPHSPDCFGLTLNPSCLVCNSNPSYGGCVGLCFQNPRYPFCPETCKAFARENLPFCSPPSS